MLTTFNKWRCCSNRIHKISKHLRRCTTQSNDVTIEEEIIIPNRIPRGPTDILRALGATVKHDPTAPHYKYHDDPYLIPMSSIGKRTFALAQEAGRKSAYWIRQQHPELFKQTLSDPPVKAYFPQAVFDENSDVSEEILKDVINNNQVSDAITIYQSLQSKNTEISKEVRQSLLELLCFYNCEDPLGEDWVEERWFKQSVGIKERNRKTWKDNGIAETLFNSFDPPDANAYNTIVQGMTKYYQVDNAMKLYEEMRLKSIPLTVETYNSIIRVSNFLRESNDMRWKLILDLLTSMNNEKLMPNIGTLNAVLQTINSIAASRQAKTYVLQTLAEFKKLGIEPSLGSYHLILNVFCKERGPRSGVLYEIMDQIENKEFKICDPKDTLFFVSAMEVSRNHLQDVNLAKRIDTFLHLGNNYDLIGDSYKESIYYRHYFILLSTFETLENFMNYYDRLVPNIYIPEPGVMSEILKMIDINCAVDLLPRIWSDMVIFDHTERENLLDQILDIIIRNKVEKESELNEKFVKIASDIWTKIEEQNIERTNKLNFSGSMLGNMMVIYLQGNDFQKACKVMNKLDKQQHTFAGVPKAEALQMFIDQCILEKQPSMAITAIQYCADTGFTEAANFASHLSSSLSLDESHIAKLTNIVGTHFLKIQDSDPIGNEVKKNE